MSQAVLEKPIPAPARPDEEPLFGTNLVVVPRPLGLPPAVPEPAPERDHDRAHSAEQPHGGARRDRCEGIAISLARCFTFEERLEIYAIPDVSYADLSRAAALRPDLMPLLNGEYEWIALTMADLD